MAFDVNDIDITQLFKNDDTYNIPRYQRRYVWDETNWLQLINDISFCAEVTPEWSHFVGSMVFERKEKSGGNVFVIDGQQRIVTFQIVIFSLIYTYRQYLKDATLSEDLVNESKVNISYLKDLIVNKVLGEEERIKLINDYESFVRINQAIMEGISELDELEKIVGMKKERSDPIIKGFQFFCNHLKSLSFEEVKCFNKQFLRTRVVTISSLQEEEVYNIFEILNARGVKLMQSELLKNYMFKYLKPKPLLDSYKKKWNEMEYTLKDVDSDDYFLHIFRCYDGNDKVTKELLFESIKKILQHKDKEELPKFFDFYTSSAEMYYDIYAAEGYGLEKEVYEYFKIKQNRQVRPLLLMLKKKYAENIIGVSLYELCLLYIRNFFITFNLDSNTSNKIDKDIAILTNKIFKSNEPYQIELAVYIFLAKFEIYFKKTDVLENGIKKIVYTNRTARKNMSSRVIVYLYKPLISATEKNKFANYDFDKFNVEHILNDCDDENIYYSVGNLLVCPKELNKAMKNKKYDEKRLKLLNSKITYLEKFAQDYEQFKYEDIENRSERVCEELVNLYALPYDIIKNRIKILEVHEKLDKGLRYKFGDENLYSKKLNSSDLHSFNKWLSGNRNLQKDEVDLIKNLIDKI